MAATLICVVLWAALLIAAVHGTGFFYAAQALPLIG